MLAIRLHNQGDPQSAYRIDEMPDASKPGSGQVAIRLEASPINPADIMQARGQYHGELVLPAIVGSESSARVIAVGPDVEGVSVGDLVIAPYGAAWQDERVVDAAAVSVLPKGIDPDQAGMMMMNAATGWSLVNAVVDLNPGDWIVQSGANSTVGQYICFFAKRAGFKTLNVVRSDSAAETVKRAGGDEVMIAKDLSDIVAVATSIKQQTSGAKLSYAIDPVAGQTTTALAEALGDGGVVSVYGALSGQPAAMTPHQLIFEQKKLIGFWLSAILQTFDEAKVTKMRAEVVEAAQSGMAINIARKYPLSEFFDALKAAEDPTQKGKILLTANTHSA